MVLLLFPLPFLRTSKERLLASASHSVCSSEIRMRKVLNALNVQYTTSVVIPVAFKVNSQ